MLDGTGNEAGLRDCSCGGRGLLKERPCNGRGDDRTRSAVAGIGGGLLACSAAGNSARLPAECSDSLSMSKMASVRWKPDVRRSHSGRVVSQTFSGILGSKLL